MANAVDSGSSNYWDKPEERLYMIYVFEKTRRTDLTPAQLKELGRIVKEELK
ncbi:MAG: hypothetical protein ACREA0_00665 [bacterium]